MIPDKTRRYASAVARSIGDLPMTAGMNIIIMVMGLITGTLLARVLGPHMRGELAAIQNWPALFATLGILGLPQSVAYFSGRERRASGAILATAIFMSLLLAGPQMILGYLLMPKLLGAQSTAVISAARWYLWLIPIQYVTGLPYWVLQGRLDLRLWNMLRLLPPLGWLLLILTLIVSEQPSAFLLAMGFLGILVIAAIPLVITILRSVPRPFSIDLDRAKPILHYGVLSMLGTVPQSINLRLDQLLIAAWLPPHVLGLYAVAVTWSNGLSPLFGAVGMVLFPRLANITDPTQQGEVLARSARLGTMIAFGLVIPLLLVTPFAFRLLFGEPFGMAIPACLILVLAGGIAGLNQILEDGLRGLGKPGHVTLAEVGGLIMTMVGLTLLLKPLQSVGAAITSLASYGVTLVVLIGLVSKQVNVSPLVLCIPTRSDIRMLADRVWSIRESFFVRGK